MPLMRSAWRRPFRIAVERVAGPQAVRLGEGLADHHLVVRPSGSRPSRRYSRLRPGSPGPGSETICPVTGSSKPATSSDDETDHARLGLAHAGNRAHRLDQRQRRALGGGEHLGEAVFVVVQRARA